MNEKGRKDKIDVALSKTYFRNTKKSSSGKLSKLKNSPMVPILIVLGVTLFTIYLVKGIDLETLTKVEKTETKKYTAAAPKSTLKSEKVLYDFEKDEEGWEIPSWAFDKTDHVAKSIKVSGAIASRGKKSLEVTSEFPGGMWAASLVEIEHYLDLRAYDVISADIYLPPDAPEGLRAKLIVTVGENWKFVEMARSVKLIPGKWTNITAKITEDSTDWKRTQVDDTFKEDIRKVTIRVESNRKPVYSGPLYVDNIRVGNFEAASE